MSIQSIALVIGDVMLDRRTEGEMNSISREAPVPVIRQTSQMDSLGGAGNVAANIKAMGHQVMLMGRVGADLAGTQVVKLASDAGIYSFLPQWDGPTIVKHRITCNGQIVTRIDHEPAHDTPQNSEIVNGIRSIPADTVSLIKVIVISDYGKGVLDAATIAEIHTFSKTHHIPVFVDARPEKLPAYIGATLVKVNLAEALGTMLHVVHPGLSTTDPVQQSMTACHELQRIMQAQMVVVTNGRHGCAYTDPVDKQVHCYDAIGSHSADSVKDVCGAGDTVMAALVAGSLERKDPASAVRMAMAAAGHVVRFYGVKVAQRDEVEEFLHDSGSWANKCMTVDTLASFVDRHRRLHPTHAIVFTNGCFDGFHAGHLQLLRFAKQQGDLLIVAYNDDESLVALKGVGRPHVPDSFRASHLALQECVDAVVRFNGDVMGLLRTIKPEVLVKGADAGRGVIPGADYVASHGGRVELCPLDGFAINIDRTNTQAKP